MNSDDPDERQEQFAQKLTQASEDACFPHCPLCLKPLEQLLYLVRSVWTWDLSRGRFCLHALESLDLDAECGDCRRDASEFSGVLNWKQPKVVIFSRDGIITGVQSDEPVEVVLVEYTAAGDKQICGATASTGKMHVTEPDEAFQAAIEE